MPLLRRSKAALAAPVAPTRPLPLSPLRVCSSRPLHCATWTLNLDDGRVPVWLVRGSLLLPGAGSLVPPLPFRISCHRASSTPALAPSPGTPITGFGPRPASRVRTSPLIAPLRPTATATSGQQTHRTRQRHSAPSHSRRPLSEGTRDETGGRKVGSRVGSLVRPKSRLPPASECQSVAATRNSHPHDSLVSATATAACPKPELRPRRD